MNTQAPMCLRIQHSPVLSLLSSFSSHIANGYNSRTAGRRREGSSHTIVMHAWWGSLSSPSFRTSTTKQVSYCLIWNFPVSWVDAIKSHPVTCMEHQLKVRCRTAQRSGECLETACFGWIEAVTQNTLIFCYLYLPIFKMDLIIEADTPQ